MEAVELVILVGIQASGKTTFYRRRLAGEYIHVSLDNWRGKSNNRRREREAVFEGLKTAASDDDLRGVVVDNTNTTVETRRRYFEYAVAVDDVQVRMTAYFFDAALDDCLARNAERPADAPVGEPYYVPTAAIRRFSAQREPPTHAEGFERVFRVKITDDHEFDVTEAQP